jgi:hypothetical protein
MKSKKLPTPERVIGGSVAGLVAVLNMSRSVLFAATLSLFPTTFTFAAPAPKVAANGANPAVMPVNSKPHGASYEEWATRWWQWEFSMPTTANPIFDTADCSTGQTDKVWFLGGGSVANFFPAPGVSEVQVTRNCVVPAGTFLFFPIINTECSSVMGDNAGDISPAGLRNCATGARSTINFAALGATLDGVGINNLAQYLVTSPLFMFGPLPNNNVLQFFGLTAPQGTTARSVTDGIYLMLHPLSAGAHALHFHSEFDFGKGSGFIQDIRYNLYVIP